jgi:hypothetical protein
MEIENLFLNFGQIMALENLKNNSVLALKKFSFST